MGEGVLGEGGGVGLEVGGVGGDAVVEGGDGGVELTDRVFGAGETGEERGDLGDGGLDCGVLAGEGLQVELEACSTL